MKVSRHRPVRQAARVPRVLLQFPTANLVHRRMLNGILRYAQQRGPWEFHVITDMPGEQGLRRTQEWGCSGIVAYLRTPADADTALAVRLPTVVCVPDRRFLVPENPISRFTAVLLDHKAIGSLAADYFLGLRFTRFAFVGHVQEAVPWSINRKCGFVQRLKKSGCGCFCYPRTSQRERDDFGVEQKRLRGWLLRLPKPIALLAAGDRRATQVLDTCLDAGLSVPHEIAVLGVDNDEVVCETASPPLTSIDIGEENAGFEAARLLDVLMRSRKSRPPSIVLHGPRQVVPRRSTETDHIADPLIAKAVTYIQTNLCSSANVSDVARHLNISRRLLEMRAKQALGGTVRDEILRVRLQHAQALLRNTAMTMGEIGAACGFSGTSHFGLRFREVFGTTPTVFRAQFRGKGVSLENGKDSGSLVI